MINKDTDKKIDSNFDGGSNTNNSDATPSTELKITVDDLDTTPCDNINSESELNRKLATDKASTFVTDKTSNFDIVNIDDFDNDLATTSCDKIKPAGDLATTSSIVKLEPDDIFDADLADDIATTSCAELESDDNLDIDFESDIAPDFDKTPDTFSVTNSSENVDSKNDFESSLAKSILLKAYALCARAEQTRSSLINKLIHRGYERQLAECTATILEREGTLSDERFAHSYLREQHIHNARGRGRLSLELQKRGIARPLAEKALCDYFDEYDEAEECRRDFERLVTKKKSPEALIRALTQDGWPLKLIRQVQRDFGACR